MSLKENDVIRENYLESIGKTEEDIKQDEKGFYTQQEVTTQDQNGDPQVEQIKTYLPENLV